MTEQNPSKYSNIRIHFKIWMSSDNGTEIVDDDKWQLLLAIHELGSLRAGAARMQVSYRKAWGDLRQMESVLGFNIIEKHRGGASGGVTILTPEGITLTEAYIGFRKEFQDAVNESVIRFKKKLKYS